MQGRGGKAQACGASMQGGMCIPRATWPHTRVHLEVSGPAPGQWNTRTPAAPCARRFCGSFFRRASHSQPAGPRTARAGRGARSGDPSPHLSGPDWSPRPHGRPAGASGLNVAPRPARLCPHTHPHTHPHTRPHNTTLMQTTAKGGQSAETGRATPQRPILRWHQDAPRAPGPATGSVVCRVFSIRGHFRGPLGVRHHPANVALPCHGAYSVLPPGGGLGFSKASRFWGGLLRSRGGVPDDM